jgi:hypothetical protein
MAGTAPQSRHHFGAEHDKIVKFPAFMPRPVGEQSCVEETNTGSRRQTARPA